MATKLQTIQDLASQLMVDFSQETEQWRGYLECAARLYKYPFADQLLIYGQRPDATACATIDVWNQRLGRWVNRNSKGIALLHDMGERTWLRYVFDIADTHPGRYEAKRPFIWAMKDAYQKQVYQVLQNTFGKIEEHSEFGGILLQASQIAVQNQLFSHLTELYLASEHSFLARVDENQVEKTFQQLLVESVSYAVQYRCGLEPIWRPEAFAAMTQFDTMDTMTVLGTATSEISRVILTEIGRSIAQIELGEKFANQEKNQYPIATEQSIQKNQKERDTGLSKEENHYAEKYQLQSDWSLSVSRSDATTDREHAPGQIWQNEEAVLEGAPSGSIQPAAVVGPAGDTSERSAATGRATDGSAYPGDATAAEYHRRIEGSKSDAVGGTDEQHSEPGGGNHSAENHFQQLEQIEKTEEPETGKMDSHESNPSFFMPVLPERYQKALDYLLMTGSYQQGDPLRIYRAYQKNKTAEEMQTFLKHCYGSNGKGFVVDSSPVAVWYGETGIYLADGNSARHTAAQMVSWEQAEARARMLVQEGLYLSQDEIQQVDSFERHRIAEQMNFVMEHLSRHGDCPYYGIGQLPLQRIAMYEETLQDREEILSMLAYCTEQQETMQWKRLDQLIVELQELLTERKDYPSQKSYTRYEQFLSDDYINQVLRSGSGFSNGKYRIVSFFQTDTDSKTQEELLRKEYGTGGYGGGGRELSYESKGILIGQRMPYGTQEKLEISLNWGQVRKRIQQMIASNQYLSQEEYAGMEAYLLEQQQQTQQTDAVKVSLPVQRLPVGTVVFYKGRQYEIQSFTEQQVILYDFASPLFPKEITMEAYETEIWQHALNQKIIQEYMAGQTEELADVKAVAVEEAVEEAVSVSEPDAAEQEIQNVEAEISTMAAKEQTVVQTERAAQPANYQITEEQLGIGGPKEKYQKNVAAIRLLHQLQQEERQATAEEQQILAQYVGWGGLAMAFEEHQAGWQKEYQELKALLTPEDYQAARASTLTAFYTSPVIIQAIYETVKNMGFQTGNILEPSCGIGNFFGLLPESMKNSRLYGVELDAMTGAIAKQLYPKAEITISGFEKTEYPDNSFDLVVGNVPFGQFSVSDPKYDKLKLSIHDYFFVKSLDQLRPGGVLAFVTSSYTMDKKNNSGRSYMAQRAELLGAIRLPNTAFEEYAGTKVTTDIIFLQKRERILEQDADWLHLGQTEEGFVINQYFIDHPEMILGELTMARLQYGREQCVCRPIPGANLKEQLQQAISHIQGSMHTAESQEIAKKNLKTPLPADATVRNYSYTIWQNQIYYKENSTMVPVEVSAAAAARIKGMIEIRDCVRTLIDQQLEDASEVVIRQTQKQLNQIYDTFTETHGLLNSRSNASAFRDDSAYPLLCSLEHLDQEGKLKRKADMFYKRTIQPYHPITHVDTPREALAVSMAERACVDLPFMQSLLGPESSIDTIIQALEGVIYKDPLSAEEETAGWQMADEYLSGNVREKLKLAKLAAETQPRFLSNVTALEAVQPIDLTAAEISVRLGSTWIPLEVMQTFMYETFKTPVYRRDKIKLFYQPGTGEWQITHKTWDRGNVQVESSFGTNRVNGYRILEDTLNLRDVRVYDYVEDIDGKKKPVLNKQATIVAQGKQEALKQHFQDWIWSDATRRNQLVQRYNELFNSNRVREYDGSHLNFPGMNPEIRLRPHQVNAVARILYGGNSLLAHVVGAGKTFEMVAAAQESKRLGLCQKSLLIVPNHLIEQWASEYLQLYPSANILVAYKKDFEKENRKKFCSRIATGDYDAIIMGHSQFEKIPMSIAHQQAFIESQINDILEGIQMLKEQDGERFQIKALERARMKLQKKLKQLLDDSRKDQVVTFEELGVDRIFVDEAHYYKNLAAYSKMRNVAGISQTEAQKSSDLFMKCRYLDHQTGGKGVIFATGTPISNSMVELYTMQRYLQYGELEKRQLTHFDCWASTFGETISAIELAPEGSSYRVKNRFARFFNLPELMMMFRSVADIQTADMLQLPVPKAHYQTITIEPSELQREMVANLAERAEAVRNRLVSPEEDNMLKITNDGRKLALDQRLLDSLLPEYEAGKTARCAENIYHIWQTYQEEKATQLVFCDLSTPGTKAKESSSDGGELFQNVYVDLKQKLIEKGIPQEEIAFIHDADTDQKKKELFAKVRQGVVRVLMGSTQKMGAGTNVQERLIALHDLDCPWRPSDLEQRSGRIIRQGNQNPEVFIYRYVTKDTFDAYLYQTVENKQKFISQIMTSKSPVRSAEDIDEAALSYAEIKMLATGNPLIKEKMDLDVSVSRLKLMKSNHLSQKYSLEDKLRDFYPNRIRVLEQTIRNQREDVDWLHTQPALPKESFSGMVVNGIHCDKRNLAGLQLLKACKTVAASKEKKAMVGEYQGFQIQLAYGLLHGEYELTLMRAGKYSLMLGQDALGNMARIDHKLQQLEAGIGMLETELEETMKQQELARKQIEIPFAQEEELQSQMSRLEEVNHLLNLDQKDETILMDDGEELAEQSSQQPQKSKKRLQQR